MIDDVRRETPYRWYILILTALTNALCVAAPSMCLSVLFDEIAADLRLDLVQVGLIWSIGALPGIVTILFAGALGDRFGPKRVLTLACLLVGLSGGLRGLSGDFVTLALAMFVFGFLTPAISMNGFKTVGLWFPRRQLGLASGVISMGMALGFMLGAMISATVLSPLLGGWRNVLLLYGAIAMTLCVPWYFTRPAPVALASPGAAGPLSMRQAIVYVAGIRKLWWLGLAILGIGGCIQGMLGYLPLHLRGLGWAAASADGAASAFHLVSMICVVPIALGSDRLGSRKKVLLPAALLIAAGVGLLAVADGALVWVAVSMAGMVRDGFMAVFMTMILESEGVGATYAGTATGFVMIFSGVGNLLAPPLGNSLASIAPGVPFLFWAGLAVLGLVGLYTAKERGAESSLAAQPA